MNYSGRAKQGESLLDTRILSAQPLRRCAACKVTANIGVVKVFDGYWRMECLSCGSTGPFEAIAHDDTPARYVGCSRCAGEGGIPAGPYGGARATCPDCGGRGSVPYGKREALVDGERVLIETPVDP